jgi:hypothetical protein
MSGCSSRRLVQVQRRLVPGGGDRLRPLARLALQHGLILVALLGNALVKAHLRQVRLAHAGTVVTALAQAIQPVQPARGTIKSKNARTMRVQAGVKGRPARDTRRRAGKSALKDDTLRRQAIQVRRDHPIRAAVVQRIAALLFGRDKNNVRTL